MGKSRAHQLIEAASTVAAISGPVVEGEPSTIVDTLPVNESQVRPLAGLDEQAKREVWAEAVATAPAGKVTGRHVEETVRRRFVAPRQDEAEAFAAYYWAGANLQAIADADNPELMLLKSIRESLRSGSGARWRFRTYGGEVLCWWIVNKTEEPDAVWSYAQFAKLSLGILPQPTWVQRANEAIRLHEESAIMDVQPASTIVDTLPGRDGRIERAQRLIDQCQAITGKAFEEEYTALVGTPSDLPAVGRALDGIVAKLEHLQRMLQGEPEVNTWGEL